MLRGISHGGIVSPDASARKTRIPATSVGGKHKPGGGLGPDGCRRSALGVTFLSCRATRLVRNQERRHCIMEVAEMPEILTLAVLVDVVR